MSEPLASRRDWIVGNASLGVEVRNGRRILALGEGVTTEEACELVAAVLPVRPIAEPPADALAAATAEVRRILLDEWCMDHLVVDDGNDEEFARAILKAADVGLREVKDA